MSNHIDCGSCRSNVHAKCRGEGCSCARAEHTLPIRATGRLNSAVTSMLRYGAGSHSTRATNAVVLIMSTMVIDANGSEAVAELPAATAHLVGANR